MRKILINRLNLYRFNKQRSASEGKDRASVLGQFLLVLAGGLIGVLGNQFFFERNKKVEANLELKREFLREQLPLYNRIVNFTKYYIERGSHLVIRKRDFNVHYDPFGLIYKRDTIATSDTTYFRFPSFVADSGYRQELQDDLAIVRKNKDKIDTSVWSSFIDLTLFLENHPLPTLNNELDIYRSDWVRAEVLSNWKDINVRLFMSASRMFEAMKMD